MLDFAQTLMHVASIYSIMAFTGCLLLVALSCCSFSILCKIFASINWFSVDVCVAIAYWLSSICCSIVLFPFFRKNDAMGLE